MEVTKSWSSAMLRCAITHLLRHRRTALLAAAATGCATALLMLPGVTRAADQASAGASQGPVRKHFHVIQDTVQRLRRVDFGYRRIVQTAP